MKKGQPTGRRIQESNQNTDHASQGGIWQMRDSNNSNAVVIFLTKPLQCNSMNI